MDVFSAPHSHFICTAEQCQQMDETSINDFGFDGFTLMEVAGSSAAKHLLNLINPESHGLFLCGKGNNAGDALVVARYLVQYCNKATIVFLSGSKDLSPDAEHNLTLLNKIGKNYSRSSIEVIQSWDKFDTALNFDFIVDGMLGTGLKSNLRGDYTKAVKWANNAELPVYSIDIPTGLHADSGKILGEAIRASTTFTFGALKQGFYLNNGFEHAGNIIYCDLPFPNYLKNCNTYLLGETWIKEPERKPARHKYDAGILYVVAGSEGLTGAAIMTARSAWAEGLGAVIIICPRGILPVFDNNLPQIIKKPVGNREDMFFTEDHIDDVLKTLQEKPGKVLFGPGIGRDASTVKFAQKFLNEFNKEVLIDADAIWSLAKKSDWQKPDEADWIMTPHPGEFSTLLKTKFEDEEDRLKLVRKTSSEKDIFIVSKGFPTIIGTPDEKCYLTGYDTRIFARAGFGDVLAGKIGAYWALGNSAAKSAALGLLNGYKKIELIKQNNTIPEPDDLI